MNTLIVILICVAWFLSGALPANYFWTKNFSKEEYTASEKYVFDFLAGILGPIGALASYLLYRYV
jgi:hypothetical protein